MWGLHGFGPGGPDGFGPPRGEHRGFPEDFTPPPGFEGEFERQFEDEFERRFKEFENFQSGFSEREDNREHGNRPRPPFEFNEEKRNFSPEDFPEDGDFRNIPFDRIPRRPSSHESEDMREFPSRDEFPTDESGVEHNNRPRLPFSDDRIPQNRDDFLREFEDFIPEEFRDFIPPEESLRDGTFSISEQQEVGEARSREEFQRQFQQEFERQVEEQAGELGLPDRSEMQIPNGFIPSNVPEEFRDFVSPDGQIPSPGQFAPPQGFIEDFGGAEHIQSLEPIPAPETVSREDSSSFLGNVLDAFMGLFR